MTEDLHVVAVIPARGGSKGIPRKNIRLLAGKPLIAHTIEAAFKTKALSRVIVSTDDEEIASVARAYGAEVIMRPAPLAVDTAPTEPALRHAVQYLETAEGYRVDVIVLLQCTSPLRGSEPIRQCIDKLLSTEADSVLTVCFDHHFHWRAEGDTAIALYDFGNRPRRQDMPPQLRENGAVYVTRRRLLMEQNNRLGGDIRYVLMDEMESLEIDTPFEFWLAERIIDSRRKKGQYAEEDQDRR